MKISDLNKKIILMTKNCELPKDLSVTECLKFSPFLSTRANVTTLIVSDGFKITIKNADIKKTISAIAYEDNTDLVFPVKPLSVKLDANYITFIAEKA